MSQEDLLALLENDYFGIWLLGVLGALVLVWSALRVRVQVKQDHRRRVGHDSADPKCRYWYIRGESPGVCQICNPVVIPVTPRTPHG